MTANPLHSSLSNEHYTPASIVEPALEVLERIDLDPASCAFANKLVRARYILTIENNGLLLNWDSRIDGDTRVLLNPPGGKYDKDLKPVSAGPGRSSAAVWWAKLIEEWRAERVHSAIFVCFSLNVFRTAQSECEFAPYAFPFVVCGDRVRYDTRGPNDERVPGKRPQQDSAVVYLPSLIEWSRLRLGEDALREGCDRFKLHFSPLGAVRT